MQRVHELFSGCGRDNAGGDNSKVLSGPPRLGRENGSIPRIGPATDDCIFAAHLWRAVHGAKAGASWRTRGTSIIHATLMGSRAVVTRNAWEEVATSSGTFSRSIRRIDSGAALSRSRHAPRVTRAKEFAAVDLVFATVGAVVMLFLRGWARRAERRLRLTWNGRTMTADHTTGVVEVAFWRTTRSLLGKGCGRRSVRRKSH